METQIRPYTTLTGVQILDSPLPEIFTREGYRTVSSAIHNLCYNGLLASWPIQSEARYIVSAPKQNTNHLSVEMPGITNHPIPAKETLKRQVLLQIASDSRSNV